MGRRAGAGWRPEPLRAGEWSWPGLRLRFTAMHLEGPDTGGDARAGTGLTAGGQSEPGTVTLR